MSGFRGDQMKAALRRFGPRAALRRFGPLRLEPESPLRLVLLLCSFALTGYAGLRLLSGDWFGILLWIVGAAILHDLVLLPLYALADRAVGAALPAAARWINHVRVPVFLSGLLLLVWFPLILGRQERRYENATGLSADVFWSRWLLITAGLFAASAVWLAIRVVIRVWRRRPGPRRGAPAAGERKPPAGPARPSRP
ncbi:MULTISPECIES: hypothetical protein [unclassified Streptomyces]|uniref:hypothetical protein n=1 Tax=unclassified Streptomyces TaxID=2593676 RepID=UPI001FF5092C|nr:MULTISPECIES: hypothetical protein [unclassified Streptomyces]WTB04949.1 hypothetical protein OG546_12455 [Streptomyces antimycoticus]